MVTAVVIAALLATTIYMKRGKMGDLGRATDQIGSQFNPHQQSAIFRTRYDTERTEKQNEDFLLSLSCQRSLPENFVAMNLNSYCVLDLSTTQM